MDVDRNYFKIGQCELIDWTPSEYHFSDFWLTRSVEISTKYATICDHGGIRKCALRVAGFVIISAVILIKIRTVSSGVYLQSAQ